MCRARSLVVIAAVIAALAAGCGESPGQTSPGDDRGGADAVSDAASDATSPDVSDADSANESESDVSSEAVDAPRGVDACTDCILATCPSQMAACFSDPTCASGWDGFEQCRLSDAGRANCWIEFGMLNDSATSDVIVCATSSGCCNP